MKIFCIGMNRTGTTSLRLAMEALGYKVSGGMNISIKPLECYRQKTIEKAIKKIDESDKQVFTDDPWFMIYKELDRLYPDSKFILTLRDPESWIKSCLKYFDKRTDDVFGWYYDSVPVNKNTKEWIESYNKHTADVIDYFWDRPDDYLILKVCHGEGWEKLIPFLGIPNKQKDPFPWKNKKVKK